MIIFGDNPYFWVVMQAYSCILDTMQYRGKWACYDTFVVFSPSYGWMIILHKKLIYCPFYLCFAK